MAIPLTGLLVDFLATDIMTKELMEKLLKSREEKLEQLKKTEEQNLKVQKERLLSLVEMMKEDLKIRNLVYNAGLISHIESFYWENRENKMGFYKNSDVIAQDLFSIKKWKKEQIIGFRPYYVETDDIEDSFYVETHEKRLSQLRSYFDNLSLSSDLLKSFCDNFEEFHKDFHKKLDSVNWNEIDISLDVEPPKILIEG